MQGGPEVWGLQCTCMWALSSCKYGGDAPALLLIGSSGVTALGWALGL